MNKIKTWGDNHEKNEIKGSMTLYSAVIKEKYRLKCYKTRKRKLRGKDN